MFLKQEVVEEIRSAIREWASANGEPEQLSKYMVAMMELPNRDRLYEPPMYEVDRYGGRQIRTDDGFVFEFETVAAMNAWMGMMKNWYPSRELVVDAKSTIFRVSIGE